MSQKDKKIKIKKKHIIIVAVCLLLLASLSFLLINKNKEKAQEITNPTLIIQTPQKVSASGEKELVLDVTISSMGEAIYPAASMSIAFDPAYLEFVGIEEGNVFITDSGGNLSKKLPEWSVDAERSNKTGKINIMYLDTTAGKNAFTKELLAKDDNVVLRLKFRLRGSVRAGDVYDLVFEDAVFAASDEAQSLAMTTDTLKVKNAKIVMGE